MVDILLVMLTNTKYHSLKNKTIYITGGATGIGSALVNAFAAQSSNIVFNDILEKDGYRVCCSVSSKYRAKVFFDHVDVKDVESLQQSIFNTEKKFGKIDVLINNVANDDRHDPLTIDLNRWNDLIAVNLNSTFFACQAALKNMVKSKSGVIINFGSINEYITPCNLPAYIAAKAGISSLSKALAKQYGVYGIRVNTILPGWIATQKQLNSWLTPEEEEKWQNLTAIKGRIMPGNIANLALFLSADDSEFITGQSFVIDAGRI